jgi:hypothetical protein
MSGAGVTPQTGLPHQLDVQAQAVAHAHHIPKQATVVVDAVGRRLRQQGHAGTRLEQRLRRRRRLRAVALNSEVDLGRVDLYETNVLTVPKHDRVAVGHIVDPVDARRVRRRDRWDLPDETELDYEALVGW